jgi:hypothetical protein
MKTSKTLQTEKVSDRDIFNYITREMLKQGMQSKEQYYCEESDMYEWEDNCAYFSYDHTTDKNLRCAVGWIMSPAIYKEYQELSNSRIEGTGITEKGPLEVVILSNSNWKFDKQSWVMLSIMQRVHDNVTEDNWGDVFENMSYLFDSDGKFQPSYVIKDVAGEEIDQASLYSWPVYSEKNPGVIELLPSEKQQIFVDFEELGISLSIPMHNSNTVSEISGAIQSLDKNCFDPKAIGLNILEAENQQIADVSAMNFLELVDSIKVDKQEKVYENITNI